MLILILDTLKGLTRIRRSQDINSDIRMKLSNWRSYRDKLLRSFHPFHRHSSTSTLRERTNDYIAFEQEKGEKKFYGGPCTPSFFEWFQGSVRRLPATWPTETTKHTSLPLIPPALLRCNSPLETRSSTLFTGRDHDRALQP